MINMVTQLDQLDSLVLVNKQQSTDDQDDIMSLAVTDLPTLSHLHDPEVQQHRQNQGEHVLKLQEVQEVPQVILQCMITTKTILENNVVNKVKIQ